MYSKYSIYLLAILLFINCASTEVVVSEYDMNTDFDSYTSFVLCVEDMIVEYDNYPENDNHNIRELIATQIENQMVDRNHKLDMINPELQAGFKLILEKQEVSFENCESEGEYQYWHECTIETFVYTEETLVLYVSDMSKNQIIWQASTVCNLNISEKKLLEYISELVDIIFNEYPKVGNSLN